MWSIVCDVAGAARAIRPRVFDKWESSHQSIQASLRPGMIQGWGWIKGHAGFVGNESLDAYSKWAAHVMIWDPSLLPRPPDRVHIQRPAPRHTQTDYHLNQAPPPLPQTRKHPHIVQLPFLQPHFMVPRPPFQMVLRKFQHGAVCFSTTTCALATATLAQTRTQWMLSLSSHTAQRANTWCKPTFSAGAPPSPRWFPNGGPRPHTSGRGAISSGGLSPCPCTPNSQPPPPAEGNQHTVMT